MIWNFGGDVGANRWRDYFRNGTELEFSTILCIINRINSDSGSVFPITCIDALHGLARQGVPESDTPVSRPSSRRQQPVVMRRPGDGLNSRQVIGVGLDRRLRLHVPHV